VAAPALVRVAAPALAHVAVPARARVVALAHAPGSPWKGAASGVDPPSTFHRSRWQHGTCLDPQKLQLPVCSFE
jgi:hypothetical protein